jgi:hypothetical protein
VPPLFPTQNQEPNPKPAVKYLNQFQLPKAEKRCAGVTPQHTKTLYTARGKLTKEMLSEIKRHNDEICIDRGKGVQLFQPLVKGAPESILKL